jgi:tetratricopeptide (TPR) repeat protein
VPEFEFTDGRKESLAAVGPGLWGDVLVAGSSAYRLLPRAADTADFRARALDWTGQPQRPHLASIAAVEHARPAGTEATDWRPCIRYHIGDGTSLRSMLEAPSPSVRIDAICAVFRSLPAWQGQTKLLLVPTAADVFFVAGSPRLLVTPRWGIPDIDQLLESAERDLYLAPEVVQGRLSADWEYRQGLYATGMLLFLAFYQVPEVTSEQRLERIAHGLLLSDPGIKCRLHGWQEKLPRTRALLDDIRKGLHPDPRIRATIDLPAVARAIAGCAPDLDPVQAVQTMRGAGRITEALQLVQELIFSDSRPDYLILAAQIHAEDLGRPLESISLYEAAIEADPTLVSAYQEQLAVLLGAWAMGVLPSLLRRENKNENKKEVDALVWRNYEKLPAEERAQFDGGMARFLLGQRKYQAAADFVYPRLFDETGSYLWFNFELTLAYAEATLELGRLDEASEQLDAIARDVDRIRQRRTMSEQELASHGTTLAGLREELENRRRIRTQRGRS